MARLQIAREQPLTYEFFLYSKEEPAGRLFKASNLDEKRTICEGRAEQGWVDDPTKLGINPGGASSEYIKSRESDFRAGLLQAIETGDPEKDREFLREAQERLIEARVAEGVAAKMKEVESLAKRKAMHDEQLNDEIADVERQKAHTVKPGAPTVEVPAATTTKPKAKAKAKAA